MSRPLRIEFSGAVYHITARGNARQKIFLSDEDRNLFLDVFASTVKRYNWLCHSYCLMDNHYHILLETPDPNLSLGMRQLNGVFTQRFNRCHERVGHLFQGRYKSILVEKESHLLELCRYIVLNPVAAGIVAQPSDYLWSSYRFAVQPLVQPEFLFSDWILSQFSNRKNEARRLYREFVTNGMKNEVGKPWGKVRGQIILGNDNFIREIKELLEEKKEAKEIPKRQRYTGRLSLAEVLSYPDIGNKEKRNAAICSAHFSYGYTLKDIADHLGIHYTTVSRVVHAGMEEI